MKLIKGENKVSGESHSIGEIFVGKFMKKIELK